MEEKSGGRYLVCLLTSAGNEKYAEQPNGDRYLVRERLTLLLLELELADYCVENWMLSVVCGRNYINLENYIRWGRARED